jgi:hypothetical protein
MTNKKQHLPKNSLTDILQSSAKDRDNTVGLSPLSKLIRDVFSDLNIRPHQFNTLLQQFLQDPINGFDTPEAKSSENGNIKKELSRPNATFKTLVKLIRILNPAEVEFSLRFIWHNKQETYHRTKVHVPSDREGDALNMLMMTSELVKERTSVEEIYAALDQLNDTSPLDNFTPPSK